MLSAFGYLRIYSRSSGDQERVRSQLSGDRQNDGRRADPSEADLRPPDGGQGRDWFHAYSQEHGEGVGRHEVDAGVARKNHDSNDAVQAD